MTLGSWQELSCYVILCSNKLQHNVDHHYTSHNEDASEEQCRASEMNENTKHTEDTIDDCIMNMSSWKNVQ